MYFVYIITLSVLLLLIINQTTLITDLTYYTDLTILILLLLTTDLITEKVTLVTLYIKKETY